MQDVVDQAARFIAAEMAGHRLLYAVLSGSHMGPGNQRVRH